ncbi:MAG: hypothetical protein E7039_08265 [Lentisphaerae bacterium]|nr:hypothetical protein [Lentisphaerota bacterium]
MDNWIDYTFHWDDAPLDISPLFADEVPAGKHGFLKSDKDKFVFEDGEPVRFWGVLLNSAACFPTHDNADMVARRMAKFGINMVRLHQFDAVWSTPNIFQFSKGTLHNTTRKLDPESLDRMDYLISVLKKEGIYVYMDLMVYRTFKDDDGLENASKLSINGAKPYTVFDRDLRKLQKEYAEQLLTHVNPYTGLKLVDDPAMAMVLITNENDMFNPNCPITAEPYRTRLRDMYRKWAEVNEPDLDIADDFSFDFSLRAPTESILRFYHDVNKDYCEEMYDYLRNIGVKCQISGTSWSRGLTLPSSVRSMDITCSNVYCDLWGDEGSNANLVGERNQVFGMVPAKIAIKDKPLFITEWDMVWPNEWRAQSSLLVAAMCAFQGWGGAALHTYRYRTSPADCMGGTVLGGVPYRRNFETFMDPAKFGLFYAAAIMFRRGDVAEAKSVQYVALSEKYIYSPEHGFANHNDPNVLAMQNCEKHKVRLVFEGDVDFANAIAPDEAGAAAMDTSEVTSDTGELYRNWLEKYAYIDTAKTKSVFGTFKAGQKIILRNGVEFEMGEGFATVTLTSLSGEELADARLILVTAVGRSDNTGAEYNAEHTKRIAIGHGPVLAEPVKAAIRMQSNVSAMRLWSIDPDGAYTGEVPSTFADGVREFKIGEVYNSIYYLLSI